MRPLQTASIVAGSFLAASVLYIAGSDWIALQLANSPEQLGRIQSIKGIVYVCAVAGALFVLTYSLLRQIEEKERRIQQGREELLAVARRLLSGTLASSIAHDVDNLTSVIKSNVAMLSGSEHLDDEERRRLADVKLATEGLETLNRRIRRVASSHVHEEPAGLDLAELVSDTVDLISTHSKLRDCELEVDVPDRLWARVFPNLVRQAVLNLTLNAAEATEHHGRIVITLSEEESEALLTVEDDGEGVEPERREAVFRPFVSDKGEGSGLGLFSVSYCAEEHQGNVELGDSTLGGVRVSLRLPLEVSDPESTSPSGSLLRPLLANERLAEDEHEERRLLDDLFSS